MQAMQRSGVRSAGAVRPGAGSRGALVVTANKRVQKKQKVILLEDVDKLGAQGQLLTVPIGYWRNFLLPNGVAKVANASILEDLRKQKEAALRSKLEEKAQAQAFANALATIGKFALKKKAGDKDQLFGSVTKQEIVDAIYQQTGRSIADLELEVPDIKALGTYECSVRLHPEVVGTFSVLIQKEKNVQAGKARNRARVVLKARPTPPGEEEALGTDLLLHNPGQVLLPSKQPGKEGRVFEADAIYVWRAADSLFGDEVRPLVAGLYQGLNATVFAYGASGSGKTHTVLGGGGAPGLVHEAIDELFSPARYEPRRCGVTVSVEELYSERFTDLLAVREQAAAVAAAREAEAACGAAAGARRPGAAPPRAPQLAAAAASAGAASSSSSSPRAKYSRREVPVTSAAQLKELVARTLRKRRTAATCINDRSSRSHAIVTITLEQCVTLRAAGSAPGSGAGSPAGGTPSPRGGDGSEEPDTPRGAVASSDGGSDAGVAPVSTYLIGKLYLVDLAGSENIKRSGAEAREAGLINRSLCHLKTVIEEVFRGGRVATYRNSKLTLRLQDALGGGNSRLLVVGCVSTARADLQETKETLRFAEMARAVVNTPVVNREPKDELIARLQMQVEELSDALSLAQGRAAPDDLLARQLVAVEAAYAELQDDAEARERRWADEAAAAAREAAELRAALQQLHGRAARDAAAQQAGLGLLHEASSGLLALHSLCGELRQQTGAQGDAARAAARACDEQRAAAAAMQQQLAEQAREREALAQALVEERAARAAAEQGAAELQRQLHAERAAAAEQAAALGAQAAAERAQWQAALDAGKARVAALQRAAADERVAHADTLAELRARSEAELEASRQSSVQKLAADKLRCKEHLALQVHSLMADAASLSEALAASLLDRLPATPTGTRPHTLGGGDAGDGAGDPPPGAQQQAPEQQTPEPQGCQGVGCGAGESGSCSDERGGPGPRRRSESASHSAASADEGASSSASASVRSSSPCSLASRGESPRPRRGAAAPPQQLDWAAPSPGSTASAGGTAAAGARRAGSSAGIGSPADGEATPQSRRAAVGAAEEEVDLVTPDTAGAAEDAPGAAAPLGAAERGAAAGGKASPAAGLLRLFTPSRGAGQRGAAAGADAVSPGLDNRASPATARRPGPAATAVGGAAVAQFLAEEGAGGGASVPAAKLAAAGGGGGAGAGAGPGGGAAAFRRTWRGTQLRRADVLFGGRAAAPALFSLTARQSSSSGVTRGSPLLTAASARPAATMQCLLSRAQAPAARPAPARPQAQPSAPAWRSFAVRSCAAAPGAAAARGGARAPHAGKRLRLSCRAEAAAPAEQVPVKLPRTGFFISKTEVPAFIPRDDMMDQLLSWAMIEAEEGGQRNFGMPMKVHKRYKDGSTWGFDLEIIKEGNTQAEMSVGFDDDVAVRSEWVGQDSETGMPTLEGKQEEVTGKHFEIWKTCDRPVDEDLRATIRAFCTGLVAALNKYYAFGSVFAEEVSMGALAGNGNGTSPLAAAAAAAAGSAAGTLGVGFSGSGFLILYFTGVVASLQAAGALSASSTHVAGSSGGALTAAAVCAGVPPERQRAANLALAARCRPSLACRGDLDRAVRGALDALLPADAAARCTGRLAVGLTLARARQRDVPLLATNFTSRAQLVDALAGSAYLPFWSGPNATTRFDGEPVYDGGFSLPLPCPPGVAVCVRVAASPPANASAPHAKPAPGAPAGASSTLQLLVAGRNASGPDPLLPLDPIVAPTPRADIFPGLSGPLDRSDAAWNALGLAIPDDATLDMLFATGLRDGAAWARAAGFGGGARSARAAG
ncbi:KIN4A [Scenedesmus sp. PABB004]|nr:KIN4A [Scenedesmus sp. PABB004]